MDGPVWGLDTKKTSSLFQLQVVKVLDIGKLLKEVRDGLSRHGYQSSKTYKSKGGKKSFAGSRYLKQTQTLGFN